MLNTTKTRKALQLIGTLGPGLSLMYLALMTAQHSPTDVVLADASASSPEEDASGTGAGVLSARHGPSRLHEALALLTLAMGTLGFQVGQMASSYLTALAFCIMFTRAPHLTCLTNFLHKCGCCKRMF